MSGLRRVVPLELQLLLARGRLEALVQNSPDAILNYDEDGRITLWNPAAERLLGHTRGQALGKSIQEFLPP
ncbi:MAG: PAS domain-containing protein, partial [Acidobacteriota bacterium]